MLKKVNPRLPDHDTCQRSLDWLYTDIEKWFQSHVPDHGHLWMADDDLNGLSSRFPSPSAKVEIIFTGSFLMKFLESGHWPFQDFRIWVLSERVKEIFINLFQLPASEIGVIGRKVHAKKSLGENFVYAGRLSRGKNIPGMLRFVSELQKIRPNVTLDIFGAFDDFPDESLGRYVAGDLRDEVMALVDNLPWTSTPVFHGDVPQDKWPLIQKPSPTFISFSSSMYEDYGTAAEIACRKGWPCFVSNWGGHSEASAWHIPFYEIPQWFELPVLQNLKANHLAEKFNQNGFSFSGKDPGFIPGKSTQLQTARNSFILHSPEALLCLRNKMYLYADTTKGSAFFREYRFCMSGNSRGKNLLISNDQSDEEILIPETSGEIETTTVRDALSPFFLKRLSGYQRIHVCTGKEEGEKIVQYLKTTLQLPTEIILWTR